MTSVLRDSLGGNCMTSMIATISVEYRNIFESLSTCKFSQRVALVKNQAIVNEEVDPHVLVARLRKEVDTLKSQVGMLTAMSRSTGDGGDFVGTKKGDSKLTTDEVERCRRAVDEFLDSNDPATLELTSQTGIVFSYPGFDMRKIQQSYTIFKQKVLQLRQGILLLSYSLNNKIFDILIEPG